MSIVISTPKSLARRRLLTGLGCALAAAGTGALLPQLSLLPRAHAAQGKAGGDYRALVCIYLAGANDSYNLLTPRDSELAGSRYDVYRSSRGGVWSGGRVRVEQLVDESSQIGGELRTAGAEPRELAGDARAQPLHDAGGEGSRAGEDLVQHHPDGEPVRRRTDPLAQARLGGPVRRAPDDGAAHAGPRRRHQPEVQQHEPPLGADHHVGGLQVAVQAPVGVQRGEAGRELVQEPPEGVELPWLEAGVLAAARPRAAAREHVGVEVLALDANGRSLAYGFLVVAARNPGVMTRGPVSERPRMPRPPEETRR